MFAVAIDRAGGRVWGFLIFRQEGWQIDVGGIVLDDSIRYDGTDLGLRRDLIEREPQHFGKPSAAFQQPGGFARHIGLFQVIDQLRGLLALASRTACRICALVTRPR
ncbi:hypothetical protein SAMN05216228_102853 [Rhizobium tibeticum]|uniref:Uncharacterized protein n=1 Tax=Rhizobium tibeticum TaxID=501024 RepID=A0A1H8TDP7_9HYPH|nr:hypothetical protein RTCCBAU85039_5154 [Rhizobium tibeticum]SEO88945.1 hypothetical protein SAMN05216228_102853 [Rhizobium tibeticum]